MYVYVSRGHRAVTYLHTLTSNIDAFSLLVSSVEELWGVCGGGRGKGGDVVVRSSSPLVVHGR